MSEDNQRKKRIEDEDEDEKDTRQFYDRGWFWGMLAIFIIAYLCFKYVI